MKYDNWLFGKDGALFRAAATGNTELVRELITAGASVAASSRSGYTPLHRAAQHGHAEIVRLLLQAGADPAASTRQQITPATLARQNGHRDVLKRLGEKQ